MEPREVCFVLFCFLERIAFICVQYECSVGRENCATEGERGDFLEPHGVLVISCCITNHPQTYQFQTTDVGYLRISVG